MQWPAVAAAEITCDVASDGLQPKKQNTKKTKSEEMKQGRAFRRAQWRLKARKDKRRDAFAEAVGYSKARNQKIQKRGAFHGGLECPKAIN